MIGSQPILDVLGILLLGLLRNPDQPLWTPMQFEVSSPSLSSTLIARRTRCGRPSSDLLSISTRRYAGVYDSRASTSASASIMASGDTDDFYSRDLWR